MNVIICLLGVFNIITAGVLDPALYLSPSPPLTTIHNNDAVKLWSQPILTTVQENVHKITTSTPESTDRTPTETPETMDVADTFWPGYRATSLKGIHIPLTFHLTGTYGGNSGTGVLTSSYMGIADGYGSQVKPALAGSGYKSYGSHPSIRVYSNDAKPAWGGWGNGKWGHYGKG